MLSQAKEKNMAKLTDTQLIILSKAARREDGAAEIPERMNKAAAAKVGASLMVRRLMREIRAKPGLPVWRMDDDGRRISLIITRAGRDAIGVADDAGEPQPPVKTRSANPSSATVTAENPPTTGMPRSGSKQALIVDADKGQGSDARRPGRGHGLAATYDSSRDDGTSQAGICDRADPPRKARIALPDRRRSDGSSRGLNRWQSQP
jgi:hypothetical protein